MYEIPKISKTPQNKQKFENAEYPENLKKIQIPHRRGGGQTDRERDFVSIYV